MDREEMILAIDPYFEKLAACGSADEIRDFLVMANVRASRKFADRCALAAYLARETGLNFTVLTTNTCADNGWDEIVLRENTASMHEFVNKFDTGHYPELELQ